LVTISYTSSNTVTVTNPGNQTSTVGTAVSLQIQATDSAGGQTLTYRATGLPPGLSISSSSGLISGTPTTAGTSSITVTATDTTGASGSASFTWTVTPAPLEVTTTSLPGATLGSAYSATLAATGGTPPYSWSVTSGSLPPGLSLSSSGTISGTPAEAGTYSLTIQAADSSSPRQTATAQLSITVGGCTTSITGSHTGQIVVGKGQFVCIGPNASQNGAITVNSGGGLSIVSSTLTGGISTGGAVSLGLSGSTINGSVSLINDNGPSVVSGNTIVGSLSCSGNNPPPVDNGQANKVSGKSSGQCSALG
jgi:Putative Ig domain